MVALYYKSKQVSRPPFSQISTDLDDTWHRSLVARNKLVFGVIMLWFTDANKDVTPIGTVFVV